MIVIQMALAFWILIWSVQVDQGSVLVDDEFELYTDRLGVNIKLWTIKDWRQEPLDEGSVKDTTWPKVGITWLGIE